MARRVLRVHLIHRIDDAAAHEQRPGVIDERPGQQRIVAGGGIGERGPAGELRHLDRRFRIDVFVRRIRISSAVGSSIARPRQHGHDGRLRFLLQVREIHEPADGRFGHRRRAALDVLAAVERGDQAPVMGLLDLAGERMIVALGTIDPRAVDDRRDRLGDLLVLVPPLVEEPDRALVRGPFGPGRDDRADDLVPRPVLACRRSRGRRTSRRCAAGPRAGCRGGP